MKQKFYFLCTLFWCTILSFGQSSATHLHFDGINDYINLGNILPTSYTKEAWVYTTSLTLNNNFISGGGDSQHAFWAPTGFGNKLSSGHNGTWNQVQDPTPLATNTWYHVAVTYDAATTTMKLYKNGVLVSTNNTVPPFSNGNMVRLGAFDNASNLLQGNIDEVRIWNVARTAEQINSSKNCELSGSESGLVTYYKFNQGFDASNNTTITTAVATTGANATLTNFALTGATSNWLAGSPVTTPTAPTASAQSFCGATTANSLVPAISSTIKWYNSATNTTALTTTDAITTATYYVAAVNANGCESARTSVAVTVNITPAPTVLPVTNFNVSINGDCPFFGGVYNYIGLLNGKANYEHFSNTDMKIGYDNVNAKWILYFYGFATPVFENTLVPAGLYPPTTGWTAVDSYCNGTLTIDSLSASFCNGATVADLTNTGTALQWYETATGGTALASTTALVTGTYYASQTVNGCESARTALSITVNPIPSAPTVLSTQVYAGTGTIANLTATGTNLQWYAAATGGTALASTDALVDGTTYYVSQTINSCESLRTAVTVRKISEATQMLPAASTVSNLVATPSTGATAQWFTAATGGTALPSTDALTTGTYYVEQTTPESIVILGSGFNGPFGVAIQADGKIVVADFYNNAIKRMDADGTNIVTLSSGFNIPIGVAIQADGKIVVVDNNNTAIKRMNADGTNIVTLSDGFFSPFGVAIQADGKIVIGDNAIKRMDADGTNIVNLGVGFNGPFGVALQTDGKIVVADAGNNAIKRMDTDGTNIVTLSDGFISPIGVAIQADGKIVVADAGNNAIKRMDADGTNIVTLSDGFISPSGVAIQADGKIVVADSNNNAIKRIAEASTSNRVPVNVDVTTLSVSNFETNGIAIYPNPSTGIFNISAQENVTIEVYDLVGKQIKTQEVPVGTSTIDISNYASGVYLLKATNTKGAVNNYKLIKQ